MKKPSLTRFPSPSNKAKPETAKPGAKVVENIWPQVVQLIPKRPSKVIVIDTRQPLLFMDNGLTQLLRGFGKSNVVLILPPGIPVIGLDDLKFIQIDAFGKDGIGAQDLEHTQALLVVSTARSVLPQNASSVMTAAFDRLPQDGVVIHASDSSEGRLLGFGNLPATTRTYEEVRSGLVVVDPSSQHPFSMNEETFRTTWHLKVWYAPKKKIEPKRAEKVGSSPKPSTSEGLIYKQGIPKPGKIALYKPRKGRPNADAKNPVEAHLVAHYSDFLPTDRKELRAFIFENDPGLYRAIIDYERIHDHLPDNLAMPTERDEAATAASKIQEGRANELSPAQLVTGARKIVRDSKKKPRPPGP
jgi:hypothetical protein